MLNINLIEFPVKAQKYKILFNNSSVYSKELH